MSTFSVELRRDRITSPVTLCLSHMSDSLTCRVLACVSELTGIRVRDMLGERKTSDVAWARQLAMALLYEDGRRKLSDVADVFDRHYATVLHACAVVHDRSDVYEDDRQTVQTLRESLGL